MHCTGTWRMREKEGACTRQICTACDPMHMPSWYRLRAPACAAHALRERPPHAQHMHSAGGPRMCSTCIARAAMHAPHLYCAATAHVDAPAIDATSGSATPNCARRSAQYSRPPSVAACCRITGTWLRNSCSSCAASCATAGGTRITLAMPSS
eukprot:358374-Chlamydomonas_euryale.AAC.11